MRKFAAAVGATILLAAGYVFGVNRGTDYNKIEKAIQVPEQIMNVNKEGIGANKYINATVIKVVDGDTMDIVYNEERYKVRLLDIDTPESVKQGVPVQGYGKQASQFTKDMLMDKPAKLVFEKGVRDKYGRLLAYVFMKDNSLINAVLVRNGFARVEIIAPNSTYSSFFYGLQQKAIDEKLGLWGLPENKRPFVKNNKNEYIPRYWSDESGK